MQTMPDIAEELCQGDQTPGESTLTLIGNAGYEGYRASSVTWGEVVDDDRIINNPINRRDPSGLLTVLVWDPKEAPGGQVQWGHVAIWLEDGTYISFWPAKGGRKFSTHTYDEDISDTVGEGRAPEGVYQVDGLDEAAIKRWWIAAQADPKQAFTPHNQCSQVTADALRAGARDPKFDLANRNNQHLEWSPHDVELYARVLMGSVPPGTPIPPGGISPTSSFVRVIGRNIWTTGSYLDMIIISFLTAKSLPPPGSPPPDVEKIWEQRGFPADFPGM